MVVRDDVLHRDRGSFEQLFVRGAEQQSSELGHRSRHKARRQGFRTILSENTEELSGQVRQSVLFGKVANIKCSSEGGQNFGTQVDVRITSHVGNGLCNFLESLGDQYCELEVVGSVTSHREQQVQTVCCNADPCIDQNRISQCLNYSNHQVVTVGQLLHVLCVEIGLNGLDDVGL